jgi:pilus assembly protein CpaC
MTQVERNRIRSRRSGAWLAIACALALALVTGEATAQVSGAALKAPRSAAAIQLNRSMTEQEAVRSLEVERGKSVLIETDYQVKRIYVGDPGIADVIVLSPRRLQLVPKVVGDTNVVLWDTGNRAQAVIDVHVGTAHSQIQTEMRRVLESEDITIDAAGESVIVKGTVADALKLEKALTVARAFFPESPETKVISLLGVRGNHQVMIEIKVAEMDRRVSRNLGTNFRVTNQDSFQIFNFLDSLTGVGALTNPGLNALDGVVDDLPIALSDAVNLAGTYLNEDDFLVNFFFQALHQKGLAKILAEPTLVARSGDAATFLVGGEVPIPVAQGGAFGSITIEFKDFGVGVLFTPTVLSEDRIHLQIAPEVSEIDFSIATNIGGSTVPGFRTRRFSTSVELGDGQSFAIAGLLREDLTEFVSQYPLLGDIPVLGTLFRSTSFLKNESELVLIVTPRLVRPLGPGPHPLPTDNFIEPGAAEFYLLGSLEGREPAAAKPTSASVEEAPTGGLIGDFGHRVTIPNAEREAR